MKPAVVVLGSSNTDMIVRVPRIPRPGETILGGEFTTAPGGKGANQAVAAARAGGAVTFVARVGQDSLGEAALRGFQRDGINTDRVVSDRSQPSGVALIFVAEGGENSIAVASGANGKLCRADINKARSEIVSADMLVAQLETPLETVRYAVELATRHGVPVILNPAPAQRLPARLLRAVSILTPNETEAELLTGVEISDAATAARAARNLKRKGVDTVILTLGARGAFVSSSEGEYLVQGFKVTPVDTTAAGDVFSGALAVALAGREPLAKAVQFANAAAALAVTKVGAQPSVPKRSQINRLLRTHPKK